MNVTQADIEDLSADDSANGIKLTITRAMASGGVDAEVYFASPIANEGQPSGYLQLHSAGSKACCAGRTRQRLFRAAKQNVHRIAENLE